MYCPSLRSGQYCHPQTEYFPILPAQSLTQPHKGAAQMGRCLSLPSKPSTHSPNGGMLTPPPPPPPHWVRSDCMQGPALKLFLLIGAWFYCACSGCSCESSIAMYCEGECPLLLLTSFKLSFKGHLTSFIAYQQVIPVTPKEMEKGLVLHKGHSPSSYARVESYRPNHSTHTQPH